MPAGISRLKFDLLEIIDKEMPISHNHPFLRNEKVVKSINILRQQANKPILKFPSPMGLAANANATNPQGVQYFNGDLTKNPPTTTTKDGAIDASQGKFENGAWTFDPNTKLKFSYTQDPFDSSFAPVTLIVTGTTLDPTKSKIDLTVAGLNIFQDLTLDRTKGEVDGTFEFFVPSVCFRGGKVEWEFATKDGSKVTITKLEVTSAKDVGSTDATLKALKQLMARLGAENGKIQNDWVDIVKTVKSFPQLASYVARTEELQTRFKSLNDLMKQTAINIKTFSDSYNKMYLGKLLDTNVTKDIKLQIIAVVQASCDKYLTESQNLTNALNAYKSDMGLYIADMTQTATDLDKAIQAKIDDVKGRISVKELELQKYQAQLVAAGAGLGASVFAGAVGVWAALAFGGPLGPFIAGAVIVVALIGAAVSIGYMIDASIKINGIESELRDMHNELDGYLAEQKQIKEMLNGVTQVTIAIKDVASYTQGFADLWAYIKNQLTFIHKAIEQWNGDMKQQPAFVEIFLPDFAKSLQPYFQNISDIMEAYVNNFP